MQFPTLVQSLGKNSTRFILEEEHLLVEESNPRFSRSSIIDLGDLDDRPVFNKTSESVPVFETVAFAGFGGIFLFSGLFALIAWIGARPSTFEEWISPPLGVVGGFGMIYFSIARVNSMERKSRGKITLFRADFPQNPALHFDDRLPSVESVETFVEQLKTAIREIHERRRAIRELPPQARELIELARLVEAGAITKEELAITKTRLLEP